VSLAAGTRLGPYEIVAPVGAGGMGEVYRAKDTRLDRTVAVKVLPAHLSSSAESRQRFEREAKTISQLSHPHICALYDVGHQDGIEFLVMEYLEGETLADRLVKGPLPFDQVLRCGLEIADAMDKAHRQGIVHRDLKPGNVMLTKSGVKLLDFGLAKAVAPVAARSGASLTALPTQAGRDLTAEGTILGTFQYMAPEQLEGRDADARTDIFAFGAVLYEMATGKKAFSGRSQASLISSIMGSEPPPASTVSATAPPAFDRVVKTCLAKDPDDRWQTAHDIAVQLKWIQEGGVATDATAPARLSKRQARLLPWTIAALSTLLFFVLLTRDAMRSTPQAPVTRFSILPPEKTIFTPPGELSSSQFALSPDGRSIVFVANTQNGAPLLWVRSFDSFAAFPLNGTEGGIHPFWSPDGRSIGFFTPSSLKRVDVAGGTPQRLCDAVAGRGGAWSRSGVILFTHSANTPIFRISETGGDPSPATQFDRARGDDRHRYPQFLPDGKRFLYWARAPRTRLTGIYVASLDSPQGRLVMKAPAMGEYAAGHLLTVQDGSLVAYPFDERNVRVTGPSIRIAERIPTGNPPGYAPFSVGGNDVIAFSSPLPRSRQLVWFDRSGRRTEMGEPGDYSTPSLSPDGTRLAVAIRGESSNSETDLWLHDFARQTWSRFTFGAATERAPVWSPDGSRIVFTSVDADTVLDVYEKPASGSGEPRLLIGSSADKFLSDWSHDGRFLVYHTFGGGTFWDIWVAPLDGRKPFAFLATKFIEVQGKISPDGRWMAYTSDESGRLEIYVTDFPDKRGRWQISTNGGTQAYWRSDGKELFYLGPEQTLMSVGVDGGGGSFQAAAPTPLFRAGFPQLVPAYWANYSPTADGQRFLVSELVAETASAPINVVLNWTYALKK
jgi:eukaryotic-like serine/threonine-protein kinase